MSSSHAALPTRSWKTFARYVAPSVSAMVLFSSYTIIDGIFVSKGVGEIALAAVNISLPFINILSGIAILLRLWKRMETLGGTIRVTGLREQPARVLGAAGLQRLFPLD